MALIKMIPVGDGSGGNKVTVEYIDTVTSGSGSSSKTVNFKTDTYARDDYADLTIDNFLIIPHRGSNEISTSTSNSAGFAYAYSYAHKNFSYNASTGVLTFYGGVRAEVQASSQVKAYSNTTAPYDIYIIKPTLSEVIAQSQ